MLRRIKYQFLKCVRFLGWGFLITALTSCASTTTVRVTDKNDSIDRNVKIYMDGSYKGKGEALYSDMKIVGSSTVVTLKKRGCRSMQHSFSRSEQLLVGALIGGFFLWPLFLWVMGYNPIHSYEFECEEK